jgi:hypothetical protein
VTEKNNTNVEINASIAAGSRCLFVVKRFCILK